MKNKKYNVLIPLIVFGILNLAWVSSLADEFLPPAHELFQPLLADPRELQYALRVVEPVSHKLLGEADMGDYLGLYRWALPWKDASLQVSGGGGVFARFELASTANDMQVVDFYGNVPIDFRMGPWSSRLMYYHTSSHLGDDYLKTHGGETTKHSWDNVKWLLSYNWTKLRLYGGYTYAFQQQLPAAYDRNGVQTGVECNSAWWAKGHAQTYWANDFQSFGRANWNPTFNSQLGVKVVNDPKAGRALSLFVEYETGRMPYGQFFLQQESHWDIGIKFELT